MDAGGWSWRRSRSGSDGGGEGEEERREGDYDAAGIAENTRESVMEAVEKMMWNGYGVQPR